MPTQFRVEALLNGISAADYVVERDSDAFRALAQQHLSLRKMEFLADDAQHSPASASVLRLATRPSTGTTYTPLPTPLPTPPNYPLHHPTTHHHLTGYIPGKFIDYLTGDQLEFVDHITYDPNNLPCADGSYQLNVCCMLPWLSKRADIHVALRFEHVSPTCCRQVLEGRIAIKIPGIGRIAEPLVVNGLRQAYADLPKLISKWVVFRETALAEGSGETLVRGVPEAVMAIWKQHEGLGDKADGGVEGVDAGVRGVDAGVVGVDAGVEGVTGCAHAHGE